jgi:hypothetical protein
MEVGVRAFKFELQQPLNNARRGIDLGGSAVLSSRDVAAQSAESGRKMETRERKPVLMSGMSVHMARMEKMAVSQMLAIYTRKI